MKKGVVLSLIYLFCLTSNGQVDIKFGVSGMNENSITMLNAICDSYGKDSALYLLDSLSYYGVFICDVDSNGFIVNIANYLSRKSSFSKEDLLRIKKYLQDNRIRFPVIYENDLGEDETLFKKRIRKDLKQHFKLHNTKVITMGFPGYLSPPWEKYLKNALKQEGRSHDYKISYGIVTSSPFSP